MRKNTYERIAVAVAALMVLISYARIYFGVGILDEAQHTGSIFMTALGGKPYFNEMFSQQAAGLLFEPLIWLYYQVFGTTGGQLACRHIYFVVYMTWAWVTFRYFRERVSFITALAIALVPAVGATTGIPSPNYFTMGLAGFGMAAVLLLGALEKRSSREMVYAGLALFLSITSYPTYGIVWPIFLIVTAVFCWRENVPFLRAAFWSTLLGGTLMLLFFGICIYRFGLDNFIATYEFSRDFGTFGSFTQKAAYTWWLFRGFAPPPWISAPILILWWALNHWARVPWVAILPALILAVGLQEPPESGPWATTLMLLLAFSSLPVLFGVSVRRRWPELALWITGVLCAPLFMWTSSMTLYVMYMALNFTMMANLALSEEQRPSRPWSLFALFMPGVLLFFLVWINNMDDEDVIYQTEFITSGYFAGTRTSKYNYDFLQQVQADIDECGTRGKTVLFYDMFAAGYLMSSMKPAMRSLLMHPLSMSWRVRHLYTMYYTDPATRPDCIFRFMKVRQIDGTWLNNDPKQYQIKDSFWSYLPEDSGEYVPLRVRDTYTVYLKKGL